VSRGLVIKSRFYGYFYLADKFFGPNLSAKSRFTVYTTAKMSHKK